MPRALAGRAAVEVVASSTGDRAVVVRPRPGAAWPCPPSTRPRRPAGQGKGRRVRAGSGVRAAAGARVPGGGRRLLAGAPGRGRHPAGRRPVRAAPAAGGAGRSTSTAGSACSPPGWPSGWGRRARCVAWSARRAPSPTPAATCATCPGPGWSAAGRGGARPAGSGGADIVVVDPPRAGRAATSSSGSLALRPRGSSTSRATRRRWPATSPGPGAVTGWPSCGPSTRSR